MAFADLINRKYQIQQQTATSEANLRSAQAEQARSAAATNPAEAAAREAQAYGTAGAETGLGGYYSALGGAATSRVPSEIGLAGAQSEQARAEAQRARSAATPISGLPSLLGSGTGAPSSLLNDNTENHAMGTSRIDAKNGKTSVPGKMPPKGQNTDVTPANLTPGEAVLNRGAAEHLGRDVIDVLNAIGNIKMQGDNGATTTNGPVTKAPTDSENGVKGYCMGGVPGYASGSSGTGTVGGGQGSGIDPIAGQGGTWGSEPKFDPRAAAGIPGVPRPAPRPIPLADGMSDIPEPGAAVGYADGTSDVYSANSRAPISDAANMGRNYPGRNDEVSTKISQLRGGQPVGNGVDRVMAATHADAVRNASAGKSEGLPSSPQTQKGGTTPGYAKGTAKVPGKGAKKPPAAGASKITPEMLAQLMALSKGGGGMIPPGQGAPMPMPMPQVAGPGQ